MKNPYRRVKKNPVIKTRYIKPHLDPRLRAVGTGSGDMVARDSIMRNPKPQRKGCTTRKGTTMARKKNPRTPMTKATAIPKGKRAGEHFTKGGKKYVVISYVQPSTGKRVRYARSIKK